ncbi:MAG: ROK family protein [Beutenbergiaceae bacterium]
MSLNEQQAKGLAEVLGLLRVGGELTRADLIDLTGRGRSTIGSLLTQLQAMGLVNVTGAAASTGGRPPATFAFAQTARIVIAIDLGVTHARVAITDLSAQILAVESESIAIADGPEVVLEQVRSMAQRMVKQSGRKPSDVAGVGIGLPGPVDHESGKPANPPIMPGWHGADVKAQLRNLLGVDSVLVDNDVNLMALGEHASGHPEIDHLLFVKAASGIGAGLISDGKLLRGAEGVAGDIGHIAVPGGPDVVCRCGNTGCLEAVASGSAILAELAKAGVEVASNADLVTLVRNGDTRVSQLMRTAGRWIGQVLAACVSTLNPSMIVVGGSLAEGGEQLLAGIREAVYGRSLPLASQNLRIVTSANLGTAGILGAATMVIEHTLSAEGLRTPAS